MTSLVAIADLDHFVATRDALHRVAEHVVAKARYVDDREIRLMAFEGGFSTPPLSDGRRVRVAGTDVVVDDGNGSRREPLTTVGEAAAFVGIEPGFPSELYAPATEFDADAPLNLDRQSAEALAAWYRFTADVLGKFGSEVDDAPVSPLILWPEHFDQAFTTEDDDTSRRANYGASPGDSGHPEPYLYVGPWEPVAGNEYWNATHFNGAVLPLSSLVAEADPMDAALGFVRTGRALLVSQALGC
jgi:hypothetical protein